MNDDFKIEDSGVSVDVKKICLELYPYTHTACVNMIKTYENIPHHLRKTFICDFAQKALTFFIMSYMNSALIGKDLHDLIKNCVDTSIERAIELKIDELNKSNS